VGPGKGQTRNTSRPSPGLPARTRSWKLRARKVEVNGGKVDRGYRLGLCLSSQNGTDRREGELASVHIASAERDRYDQVIPLVVGREIWLDLVGALDPLGRSFLRSRADLDLTSDPRSI
jgi:hypothetical protein